MAMDVSVLEGYGHVGEAGVRASSYNIYIDLPEQPETFLLVHGYTGAHDRVSRGIAAYVRSLESQNVPKPLFGSWQPEEIDQVNVAIPSRDVYDRLKKRGFLTTKTLEEEEAYFVRHVAALRKHQMRRQPSYIIMPSYDCNLRCHYCFQDFMRTKPEFGHLLKTMSTDMADRILKSLPSIEDRYHSTQDPEAARSFTFFGGEPLTRENRNVVEYFINGALEMGKASFSAITNGTELDAYSGLLGPDRISWLQITLDGPPAEHDKRRIRADGSGSFAEIADNIDLCLSLGVHIAVRINVDRSSIGGIPELAKVYFERGWASHKNFSCYVAPVRDNLNNGSRSDYFNTYELGEEIARLKREHPEMRCINSTDLKIEQSALRIFQGKSDGGLPNRTTFCGAHSGMYVFDPFGDIYACWERTGNQNIRIGYVEPDGKAVLNDTSVLWQSRDVTSNPTCRKCRFSLYCGGGCAILAEETGGTMFTNYCDAFGKRLRSRIAHAYEAFLAGTPAFAPDNMAAVVEEFVR